MVKCQDCANYHYDREIFLYANAPATGCGFCKFGRRVFSIDPRCDKFSAQKDPKYHKGDIFGGKHAIYIERIQPECYPRIYRVRTTGYGGYSLTEEELDAQFNLIWEGSKDDN